MITEKRYIVALAALAVVVIVTMVLWSQSRPQSEVKLPPLQVEVASQPDSTKIKGEFTFKQYLAVVAPLVIGSRTEDPDTIKLAFLSADYDTIALLVIAKDTFIINSSWR